MLMSEIVDFQSYNQTIRLSKNNFDSLVNYYQSLNIAMPFNTWVNLVLAYGKSCKEFKRWVSDRKHNMEVLIND